MKIPEGFLYTNDHEWAKVEGDNVRMGITDYAQHELGDIVFVDLSPTGRNVRKGDSVGTVESVKAVSDIYAPVSGTIISINAELETSPDLVNKDCYGRGWMIVISAPFSGEDTCVLMDATFYREYLLKETK